MLRTLLILAQAEGEEAGLKGIFEGGGAFMYILAGMAGLAVFLIIERLVTLVFRYKMDASEFTKQVIAFIESQNSFSRALELVNTKAKHPVAQVLKAGLLKGNRSDKELQRTMEEAALKAVPTIKKRTGYVQMMANIATLTGLLGTIFGLILAFTGIAEASAAEKQNVLANGISMAMYTTAGGLCVAIPCVISATFLQMRQNRIIESMEEAAVTLFNYLSTKNREAARLMQRSPEAA